MTDGWIVSHIRPNLFRQQYPNYIGHGLRCGRQAGYMLLHVAKEDEKL